jgi:hypothetical protein
VNARTHDSTRTIIVVLVGLLAAFALVRWPSARSPSVNRADAGASTIERMYTETHAVRGVDGRPGEAEDVAEVVQYDATHVFLWIATRFDNGASCGLSGIAGREDHAFVYRTRALPPDGRLCTLVVDVGPEALRITDRQKPDGIATCNAFCGMRGSLSSVVLGHQRRLRAENVAHLKHSVEFAEAEQEFKAGPPWTRSSVLPR